jgi:glycosyltransferase involved in cell wall biosynthesis
LAPASLAADGVSAGLPKPVVAKVVLFYSGLGRRGGVTPDLLLLAKWLEQQNVDVDVASGIRDIRTSTRGRSTVVNVYGCVPSLTMLCVMALARWRQNTLVWTPVYHPHRRRTWSHSVPHLMMRAFDSVAPHLARFTAGVSAATEEEADYFRRMGAPEVAVISLPLEDLGRRLGGAERRHARKSLGLGEGPLVLIVAAHSPRRKGMSFAAETLELLRRSVPDVTFVLAGGGDPGALSNQPGVANLGWCAPEALVSAYASSDVLFVPSLYEQFSRATIEAWANELPVVLTDGVGLGPLTTRSGAGLEVPYGDAAAAAAALGSLLCDPERRLRMGHLGRSLVAAHNSGLNYASSTMRLYEAAVSA